MGGGGGDSFALGVMVAGCILDGFQGVIGIVYDKSFFSNLRRTMLLSFDNQIVSFTEYLKTKLTFAQIPICLNNRRLNHIVN